MTGTDDDQDDGLTKLAQPLERRRMPRAPIGVMKRTSPLLLGLVPRRVAMARVEAQARADWREDPRTREWARASMAAIVSGTPREGELDELAEAMVVETRAREALFWRPWRQPHLDERSAQFARAAFSSGRGVLITGNHLAPVFTGLWTLRHMKPGIYLVCDPWLMAEPNPDYWGRYVARWREGVRRGAMRPVETGGGTFLTLRALLERGETVLLAADMPGKLETQFLGKPVMLAAGSAALAHQTGALVLPMRQRREGHRVFSEVLEAIDARDFDEVEPLHRAIMAVHERWILETPYALEDPRRAGAWEDCATPTGWQRPRRARRDGPSA
jgi:lauroyl/myristoyl acyltransferase